MMLQEVGATACHLENKTLFGNFIFDVSYSFNDHTLKATRVFLHTYVKVYKKNLNTLFKYLMY